MGTATDFRRLPHIGDKAVADAKIVDSPPFFAEPNFYHGLLDLRSKPGFEK